jgi:diaminopimelate decarboxylase
MFNESIRYDGDRLFCDSVPVADIVAETGTPVYIYSLKRAVANLREIQTAFPKAHIHYSAKANANLAVLRSLIEAGAGIDAVSGGEIHRALKAGAKPENIVFAGVGKTSGELYYAVEHDIGWFNLENIEEARLLNSIAGVAGKKVRVAIRFNPDVAANTHRHIATGHGGAKFGLNANAVKTLLDQRSTLPNLHFEGLHIHIGSQLGDADATVKAVQTARDLIKPYPNIKTLNIGGGFPANYNPGRQVPTAAKFATALEPLLKDYEVILEPGRSIIADAGMLVTRVLYLKSQGGQRFAIVDAGMTDLIRPALYDAYHEIVPITHSQDDFSTMLGYNVVGPVCESADVLSHAAQLPPVEPNALLAVLTAGAYGMVMASNYNARPRPPEVVVSEDGLTWKIARRRETWDDLTALERDIPAG